MNRVTMQTTVLGLSIICEALFVLLPSSCSSMDDQGNDGLDKRTLNQTISEIAKDNPNSDYEATGSKSAKEVLKPGQLMGPGYTIDNKVEFDGIMYFFTIKTKLGDVDAYGLKELAQRSKEVPAAIELSKISTAKFIAKEAVNQTTEPYKAAVRMVKNPVGTAKAVPGALGRLYNRAADAVKSGAEAVSGSSDDEQGESSTLDSAKGFVAEKADDYLGFSEAKRKLAAQYKVDPYTRNPIVQKELTRLGRATAVTSVGTFFVPSVPGIDYAAMAESMVWEKSEADLDKENTAKLAALGVSAKDINKLVDGDSYTPTEVTRLVLILQQFKGIGGIPEITARAAKLTTASQISMRLNQLALLADYQKNAKSLKTLTNDFEIVAAYDSQNNVVVPFSGDNLMWVQPIANYSSAVTEKLAKKAPGATITLYTSGEISPRAKSELERKGWIISKKV